MIAVDVMGGDYSPQAIVMGAYLAAQNNVPVVLFGPEDVIASQLFNINQSWQMLPITISHAPDVIAMDDEPVMAVKKGRGTSLVCAVESVRRGVCSAVVSAGNSGALMVASMLILGKQDGVERVPIAGLLPSLHGKVVGLDLGANTECRPQHLYQFAHLGASYAQEHLGIARPRVGLLANGHEDSKGSILVKDTFPLLKQSSLNFIGNVEPEGIIEKRVDVVVCDGFSGNILLKTLESSYDLFMHLLKRGLSTSEHSAYVGEAEGVMSKFSPKDAAGALLLGIKGKAIVCHGNSNGLTMSKAISFAFSLEKKVCDTKKTEKSLNF